MRTLSSGGQTVRGYSAQSPRDRNTNNTIKAVFNAFAVLSLEKGHGYNIPSELIDTKLRELQKLYHPDLVSQKK